MSKKESQDNEVERLYRSFQESRDKRPPDSAHVMRVLAASRDETSSTGQNLESSIAQDDGAKKVAALYRYYQKSRGRPSPQVYDQILQAAHDKIRQADENPSHEVIQQELHKERHGIGSLLSNLSNRIKSLLSLEPSRWRSVSRIGVPVGVAALLMVAIVPIAQKWMGGPGEETGGMLIALDTEALMKKIPDSALDQLITGLPSSYGFTSDDSDAKKSFRLGIHAVDWHLAQRALDKGRLSSITDEMIITVSSWKEAENLRVVLNNMRNSMETLAQDPGRAKSILRQTRDVAEQRNSGWYYQLGQWVEVLYFISDGTGEHRLGPIPDDLASPAKTFASVFKGDPMLSEPAKKLLLDITTPLISEDKLLDLNHLHQNALKLKLILG